MDHEDIAKRMKKWESENKPKSLQSDFLSQGSSESNITRIVDQVLERVRSLKLPAVSGNKI